jgi:hypothetical protein
VVAQIALIVDGWSNASIVCHMDPNVIGEPDQYGTVTLVVVPVGQQQIQKTGFNFWAAKEEVQLTSFPVGRTAVQSVTDTIGNVVWTGYLSPSSASTVTTLFDCPGCSGNPPFSGCSEFLLPYISFGQPGDTLDVTRSECGRFGSGTDTFDLSNLPQGLSPANFQLNTYDYNQSDCSFFGTNTTLYIDGNWNDNWLGTPPNEIQVVTQATECHVQSYVGGGGDDGISSYGLIIWVWHPKGVSLPAI